DFFSAHAGGVACADEGADRSAGNRYRFDAQFVERFEHDDMSKAARAAAAKRQCHALAHAPASRAKVQAVSASGRTSAALAGACSLGAVPSRTRPAIPCKIAAMRKKL